MASKSISVAPGSNAEGSVMGSAATGAETPSTATTPQPEAKVRMSCRREHDDRETDHQQCQCSGLRNSHQLRGGPKRSEASIARHRNVKRSRELMLRTKVHNQVRHLDSVSQLDGLRSEEQFVTKDVASYACSVRARITTS
jgi:hypothetical protein